MEDLFLLLGLFGLIVVIGGIVGFVSLFGNKPDYARILMEVERELGQLKERVELLEKLPEKTPVNTAQAATLKTDTPTLSVEPEVASLPIADIGLSYGELSDDELTKQALAVETESESESEVAHMLEAENIQVSSVLKNPSDPTDKPVRLPYVAKPHQANFIEKGIAAAKDWLLGGNTLVRSGIVILFIGISFLLKYAAEHSHVPIELRLMGIVLGGIVLLALGWRLRDKRPQYSWALQGGGIGILYLTIFAALKLYQLIPAGPAFALLAVVAFLSAFIAVKQSAMPLAILGFAGGFLAPVLTSTGHGSHVGLFSYYLVLNLAIAFVAFHKSWRPLNVLGWAFTFIIGTLWGAKNYTPENFVSTEPFLIIFFLLFTGIVVLFAHRQAAKAADYVDATLVFGTPLVSFSLQYALLRDSNFGLAYSALALGIFYIALAWWVFNRKRETLKFLGECFLALGIGFITLTLPLALDGRWTSAAWAVEGVGLLWVGLRQNRTFPTLSGLALQLLGAAAFAQGWGLPGYTGVTHQNMFLGVGFIALSGWACGALWNHYRPEKYALLTTALGLWGWLWWVAAGLTAIDEFLPYYVLMHVGLGFVAMTSVALPFIADLLKWQKLAKFSALLLPAMLLTMFWEAAELYNHPFAHYGIYAWPAAFAAYIWLLMQDKIASHSLLRAPVLWIAAIVGVLEWQYQLDGIVAESKVWREIGWAIVPILLVIGVHYWQFAKKRTLDIAQLQSARTWAWIGGVPIMLFLAIWFMLMSLNSDGNAAPLPYVPLINPLDISLMGVLLLIIIWQRAIAQHLGKLQNIMPIAAGVMGFTLLNGVLLRTLHYWLGTPFEWASIFSSPIVQMAFTFLWGATAFMLMLLAHQRAERRLWMVGAGLMGLVVVKIFLLDLAQTGSVERISSFIGAGLMLLVMGYFAPLPPAKTLVPANKNDQSEMTTKELL